MPRQLTPIARLAGLLASLVFALVGAMPTTDTAPSSAQNVIAKMVASNPALQSYRAHVHVDMHMLNFPYLSPQLDGTSYYKKPASYEVIFESVPFYMKNFSRLFVDVGQPSSWQRDQNVVLVGPRMLDGRTYLVLRMTKKIHSDILDHTDAYVDPHTYEVARMEWYYRSGGTIVITQSYRTQHGFVVPSSQHAAIDIPRVHAVGDVVFDEYQINVGVDDAVFSQ